jgi:predicted DNA-binding transcriptional regulator AlpA
VLLAASYFDLDSYVKIAVVSRPMSPKTCTTGEAAKAAAITRATLQEWIRKGKFAAPKLQRLGNIRVRLWTTSDVARLKATKKKIYQDKSGKT